MYPNISHDIKARHLNVTISKHNSYRITEHLLLQSKITLSRKRRLFQFPGEHDRQFYHDTEHQHATNYQSTSMPTHDRANCIYQDDYFSEIP